MNKIFVLFITILSITSVFAQNDILDSYIQTALKNNLTLQQKEYSYQKSLEALKEAKRMFLPTVSFQSRYTITEGGRVIELPISTMVNPIYNNLNQINQTLNPAIPTYPNVENPQFTLVRSPDQETKIVATMPLFNASIIQSHKIKKEMAEVEKISVSIYKRELVKEVKEAYVKYLQAEQMYLLFENALKTVRENLKGRESLYKNGKITIDEIYAAKAQIKQVDSDKAQAIKSKNLAAAWFNFLLNRSLDSTIEIATLTTPSIPIYNLEDIKHSALTNREEFTQLDTYIKIKENAIKLEKGTALPQVSLYSQYGYQGTDYSFNSNADVAAIGFSMKWNLFTSGQRKSKINQAKIDHKISEVKKQEAQQKVQLEAVDAYYSIQTALKSIELANEELENYKESYKIVEKKYNLGMVNYIAYSNALTNKLNAESKLIVEQYNFQIEQIQLERLTSSYQF